MVDENTTAEANVSSPEGNEGTEATTTETPNTETPTDDVTGLEVESKEKHLLESKPNDKVEESKEESPESKEEDKGKEESEDEESKDKEPAPKTMEELGYGDVSAEQKAVASLATEMGVSYDDLLGAIEDGKFDATKLEGLSSRDAQLLQNSVDVELTRLANVKTARRNELYDHVGGEDNFKQMVDYTNKLTATDEKFKAEVTDLLGMMREGGKPAELAVKSLFEKFKADPNTSLAKTSEGSETETKTDSGLSKREKLDKGWANLQEKFNK